MILLLAAFQEIYQLWARSLQGPGAQMRGHLWDPCRVVQGWLLSDRPSTRLFLSLRGTKPSASRLYAFRVPQELREGSVCDSADAEEREEQLREGGKKLQSDASSQEKTAPLGGSQSTLGSITAESRAGHLSFLWHLCWEALHCSSTWHSSVRDSENSGKKSKDLDAHNTAAPGIASES